ncbi:glycosyltransferase family 4 protein [Rhizosphaericola mali]|uniref:Glycosyltransferase family 4 protein n=1 Tax=Rhizosphaericola mali TaxID=2545455 RepID=A0A5P2G007_9BACT|nr:glycosyltransferase family 4 protein [Rhizosphaericola mali]QES87988.1 glycosyltransferase family 4 protein [Rhizosphaericola mali]
MSIVVSHPTGNQNVRALLAALERNNLLNKYFTTVGFSENTSLIKFLGPLKNEAIKRLYSENIYQKTETFPWLELGRIFANKAHLPYLTQHENGIFSVDHIYKNIDNHTAKFLAKRSLHIQGIYSYEDCAFNSFKVAKEHGMSCYYELPIAYWATAKSLLTKEADRLPEWAITLGGGIADSEEKLNRKSTELNLADKIIVPSKFVKDSLPKEIDLQKVIMSPFGSPSINPQLKLPSLSELKTRKLKVLFVGGMGQRKGLGDLFNAMKTLNGENVELIVLGSPLVDLEFYKKQYPSFIYAGLKPHAEVLQLMSECDVFCLPSIVEGRALVLQEAMSQGLPLIITPNTGGEDLIEEGKTGFLVNCGDHNKIAEKIQWLSEHKEELLEMKYNAIKKATLYSWEGYGDLIVNGLN